jgi:methylated-DNA-[protein]-cysteine S-methyltransferase
VAERISRKPRAARRTDMKNDDLTPEIAALAAALAAPAGADDAAWRRLRDRVATRALATGLADVAVEQHDSPLGRIVLGATEAGLVRVGLPVEDEGVVLDELAARVSPRVLRAPRAVLGDARRQLDEYFAGRRRTFDVVLDWCLTAGFRRDVLRATAAIPFGRTATYREIAARAGSPAAFRATGSALATNPLPIVVPCHRVLPSGGGVGQYRGGTEAKTRLLALEGAL